MMFNIINMGSNMIESIGQWVASNPNTTLVLVMFWLAVFGAGVLIDLVTDKG